MFAIRMLLAVVFAAAGLMKVARSGARLAHDPQLSTGQMKLLGVAEVLGAIGLVAPAAIGVAPYLTRVAAACLATLMGGAVATLAIERKSAILPTVMAVLLILVATVP
jgi:uncharacterized membrane protein YphA (DoxX/SURF4 family)